MPIENFNENIYEIVEAIPLGKVATYGQIARAVGAPRSARAVGRVMKNAPPERGLPCYRVVAASGKLAPHYVFGSYEAQRAILEDEGVIFKANGTIDLKKSLWQQL